MQQKAPILEFKRPDRPSSRASWAPIAGGGRTWRASRGQSLRIRKMLRRRMRVVGHRGPGGRYGHAPPEGESCCPLSGLVARFGLRPIRRCKAGHRRSMETRNGNDAIIGFQKSRPKEFRWSIFGMTVGAVAGTFVGGIGIAALGTAWGLWGWLVFAVGGGVIGNRIGIEKDRPEAK
jgi:hypothetical protein